MTARERLIVLRRMLATVLLLRAVTLGTALVLAGIVVARALALPAVAPLGLGLAGVGVAVLLASRARPARSLERVALWVEEHHPSLRYALVTVASAGAPHAAVEEQALRHPWWEDEHRRLLRVLGEVAPQEGRDDLGKMARYHHLRVVRRCVHDHHGVFWIASVGSIGSRVASTTSAIAIVPPA